MRNGCSDGCVAGSKMVVMFCVLLVGDHQHRQAVELLVVHHVLERRLGFVQPLGVARVDHVDDGVGVGEVALPDGAQALLAAEVPERDLAVPRLHAADYVVAATVSARARARATAEAASYCSNRPWVRCYPARGRRTTE